MCQLLGMNCNVPTDICFSFSGFRKRGGETDVHRDGWGIGFFEGKGSRVFLDPEPSAHSVLAELVRSYPIRSLNVIAHIRKATEGDVSLENTHPFLRELWGRHWLFAHNGHLPDFRPPLKEIMTPVGNTDSEWLFCWILESLRRQFGARVPYRSELFTALRKLTLTFAERGISNFLLSNGDFMVAHCSTQLSYIVRQAPFGEAHLSDEDMSVDFRELTKPEDCVAVITSFPLTDNEAWVDMRPGTLWMFCDGDVYDQCDTKPSPFKTMADLATTTA